MMGIGMCLIQQRTLFAILMAQFMLSGCCIFGFKDEKYYDWEFAIPGDGQEAKASCEVESRLESEKRKTQFRELVSRECKKEKPFESKEFVNPSTGVRETLNKPSRFFSIASN